MGGWKHKIQMRWFNTRRQVKKRVMRKGYAIVFVAIAILILTILGMGLLSIAYGTRLQAIRFHTETIAKMAAEAGYENAIHWMNDQPDVLSAMIPGLKKKNRGRSGTKVRKVVTEKGSGSLPEGIFSYTIDFDHFMGHLPVFRIVSRGSYKQIEHTVEAKVVQSIFGLDVGRCEIPIGPFVSNFEKMYFEENDVLDMPIHISGNADRTFDRNADIYIKGKPHFKQKVSVSESRFMTSGRGSDKYKRYLSLFDSGLYFCQPQSNIATFSKMGKGNVAIKDKTERFSNFTKTTFNFSRVRGNNAPKPSNAVPNGKGAVQIEFYIDDSSNGKMRITNNSTVVCKNGGRYDYMIDVPESIRKAFKAYNIYGYHYRDTVNTFSKPADYNIEECYVTNEVRTLLSPAPIKSDRGGQIFVDGNVIVGGATVDNGRGSQIEIDGRWYDTKFQGSLTIVATGNIWIVNSIVYDGEMQKTDEGFDVPAADNPNILGLFARDGVVKIVDPAQSASKPAEYSGLEYCPIGFKKMGSKNNRGGRSGRNIPDYMRELPNPMVVHAAITAGGGGWGVENVTGRQDTINIDDRNPAGMLDDLVVAGSITEFLGDMVSKGNTGYNKHYYFDKRLLGGILPGDIWLQRKFTPKPGGWKDYRP